MASGDGLIVRVRASARQLTGGELRALARLAQRCGAQVELTRLANLQLRGLSMDAVREVQHGLVQLGLADADPALEQRPGLSLDPLSGLDEAHAELSGLSAELDRMLRAWARETQARDAALPNKFAIVLAGHERALSEVFGDIRVCVSQQRSAAAAELSVAGCAQDAARLGVCRLDDVPDAVERLLRLRARKPMPRRSHADAPQLRAALADVLDPEQDASAQERQPEPHTGIDELTPRRRAQELHDTHANPMPVGFHKAARDWFGIGLAFGAADNATWLALADLAERYGSGSVRTTPERTLIIPDVERAGVPQLTAAAEQLGLITAARDPLLRAFACSGTPACASALGPTRTWARALAEFLDTDTDSLASAQPSATLHISGCDKSCAAGQRTSIALVHTQDGCKLGFDASIAEAALMQPLPLTDIEAQLRARATRRTLKPLLKQIR